jgi:intracellular septation protein A
MNKGKEILEELTSVLSGKTLDAILPPLIFVIINSIYGLTTAIIVALVTSATFGIYRLIRKQSGIYALGGSLGILLAGGFAYLANNASNYFLPGIVTNAFVLILTVFTLIIDKPFAAYASHLTRGWTLDWFWRKDIKPAYREVTYMWSLFFLIRTIIQVTLFLSDNVDALVWANTIMGLPVTVAVLVLSYIYGIWRLRNLKGPGIDEYLENKNAPFRGQTRGF